ncbi:MAG TPA: methyltransferase [Prolixibacteraceae bacterium]|nr:methyltransferase [Prolixibacteraceae bacterium]
MSRNNWFVFKQFRIEQQKAAMKVGTDGVLLGAWSPVNDDKRILDVGTGTGLIALMLAQRSEAIIDAVEIDELACEEAEFNFAHSPWNDRLKVFNTNFQKFSDLPCEPYDLIVSNPPFFVNSLKTKNAALSVARHNDVLTFEQLAICARKLLHNTGRLCVIIPFTSCEEFRGCARLAGFYLRKQTQIIPKFGKIPKRVLLEFTVQPGYPINNELVILGEDGYYTEDYKTLTASYYPAF